MTLPICIAQCYLPSNTSEHTLPQPQPGANTQAVQYNVQYKQCISTPPYDQKLNSPACTMAACTAIAPSRVAGIDVSEPRNKPTGVRTALAITTSCTV